MSSSSWGTTHLRLYSLCRISILSSSVSRRNSRFLDMSQKMWGRWTLIADGSSKTRITFWKMAGDEMRRFSIWSSVCSVEGGCSGSCSFRLSHWVHWMARGWLHSTTIAIAAVICLSAHHPVLLVTSLTWPLSQVTVIPLFSNHRTNSRSRHVELSQPSVRARTMYRDRPSGRYRFRVTAPKERKRNEVKRGDTRKKDLKMERICIETDLGMGRDHPLGKVRLHCNFFCTVVCQNVGCFWQRKLHTHVVGGGGALTVLHFLSGVIF